MNHSRALMCLSLLLTLGASFTSAASSTGRQVETLWRGVLKGDSLFVRAAWIPTAGSAACYQNETSGADTSEIRRKYVGYTVEDLGGKVWNRGVLSEPESLQFCCDRVVIEATPWPGRLVVKLTALGWGCEPAGDCSAWRFIYVAGRDSVAESDWTDIAWDPTTGSFTDAWVTENCIRYPMRLKARVRGSILEFAPTFQPGVKEGDLIEKDLDNDDEFMDCLRPFGPKQPTSVAWYRTPDSKSPEQLLIRSSDTVEVLSAVIRAERSRTGTLAPRIVQLGVQVSGQRGFLTRADLKALGFLGL